MTDKIRIIALGGPTASGKSSLAMELAQRYNGVIVSCDSMQVYRKMDIGTAKPTKEDREKVVHKMIDIVEPYENYSCADYVKDASLCIKEVANSGKLPIVCGGTGLYLDALLRSSDFSDSGSPDENLRRELFEYAEKYGKEKLFEELVRIDPESAAATHPNNIKRVVRAIEIYRTTGQKKSDIDKKSLEAPSKYDATVVALRYGDRNILAERINKRVDMMIADGLEEETRLLMNEGVFDKNTTAAQAIGYKEFLGYFRGESSFEECTERLKISTRQYAKRQMTWFKNRNYVNFLDVDSEEKLKSFKEIVNSASRLFSLS